MTAQDRQIRYGAVSEPAPCLSAFSGDGGRELCELWIVRNLLNSSVNCVNFARHAARKKGAVICVNFGLGWRQIMNHVGIIGTSFSSILVQKEHGHA